jgi:hypothetical protein
MAKNFPVEVIPLKLIKVTEKDITAFGVLRTGWTMESTYESTPHRYTVDSADVLLPRYMDESKKTRWVSGWVQLKTLLSRYPEDPFLQQCSKVDIRREPSDHLASMMEIEDEKVINVRVVTPVKIRIHGLLHKRGQLHEV